MFAPDVPIKITDNLYLANFTGSENDSLAKHNITAVVCLTRYSHEYPENINLLHIDDIGDSLSESSFPIEKLLTAVDFIKTNISKNKNVLVHCRAGASRSPTVIIAYIMQRDNLTASEAIDFVASKAPHINPTFLKLLDDFEALQRN